MNYQHSLLSSIFSLNWVNLGWYKYLFSDLKSRYNDERFWKLRMIYCRIRGHAGVVWYNANGFEPDMTCKNCGEDLG